VEYPTLAGNLVQNTQVTFPGPAIFQIGPGLGEDELRWEWDAPDFENNLFAVRSKHPPGTGEYTQNEFHFRHEGMEVYSNEYGFFLAPMMDPANIIGHCVFYQAWLMHRIAT